MKIVKGSAYGQWNVFASGGIGAPFIGHVEKRGTHASAQAKVEFYVAVLVGQQDGPQFKSRRAAAEWLAEQHTLAQAPRVSVPGTRKLLSIAHHRNGVCGVPFDVALFQDDDGTTKLAVAFADDPTAPGEFACPRVAVLQVDLLAKGNIAFGSNSWRDDYYAEFVRSEIHKAGLDR